MTAFVLETRIRSDKDRPWSDWKPMAGAPAYDIEAEADEFLARLGKNDWLEFRKAKYVRAE